MCLIFILLSFSGNFHHFTKPIMFSTLKLVIIFHCLTFFLILGDRFYDIFFDYKLRDKCIRI